MERTAHRPRGQPSSRDDPAHSTRSRAAAGKVYQPDRSAHRPGPFEPQSVPEVATDSATTRSSAAPFRDFIEGEFAKGRNATAIYQDLVEHHGYGGSYDAVKRFIRKLRTREPKISCRFETEPGQEMQVDYGEGALTRDPRTGKYRRPRLFTLTLSNSRHTFQKAVWNSSTRDLVPTA